MDTKEYKALLAKTKHKGPHKSHKYRAIPKVIDGIRFSSTKEAKRYEELKALQGCGDVLYFSCQPKFRLFSDIAYVGDFEVVYRSRKGVRVEIEDVKGVKTPVYKIKKKLMRHIFGIEIVEV